MITLRPYQEQAVAAIIESLRAGKHPVCQLPTGAGKTACIAELCKRLDGRILVVSHRKELIAQNQDTIVRIGESDTGVYSAGLKQRIMDSRVIVAGVASIYKRMSGLQLTGQFRYVIIDESHYGVSDQFGNTMYDQVLQACPTAQRIGLSATPYRMPDTPIWGYDDAWFDELAVNVPIIELTNQGYLCRLVGVQTASSPKLDHVRTRNGDFAIGDLSQASSEEDVVNSACDEILYLAQDRKHILIFCVDVMHANIVAEALRDRGCEPEVVVGTTPAAERDDILVRFKNGDVRHLVSVGVLTTGYDYNGIDCVVLMRSTMSKSLCVQMIGRGSRPNPEKLNCLILDCGGNLARHAPIDGLPNILRSPALAEKQEKAERERRQREEQERKVRHDAMVARGIDPLTTEAMDEGDVLVMVTDVVYKLIPAKRYPGRQNLLVSYKGITTEGQHRTVTQFVLLDYPGRQGAEASAWFARRGMEKPFDSKRALGMAWDAPRPDAIVVRKNGQWDRVVMEQFGRDSHD